MPIAILEVTNLEDQTLAFQSETVQWRQKEGNDDFQKTEDLLVTPPIFTLPPQKKQTIRVAFRKPFSSQDELSYRLFIKELPDLTQKEDYKGGIKFLLTMSVPVFIKPLHETPRKEVWHLHRLADNQIKILLENAGNSHLIMTSLSVEMPHKETLVHYPRLFHYLLPHQSQSWTVTSLNIKKNSIFKIKAVINGREYGQDVSLGS